MNDFLKSPDNCASLFHVPLATFYEVLVLDEASSQYCFWFFLKRKLARPFRRVFAPICSLQCELAFLEKQACSTIRTLSFRNELEFPKKAVCFTKFKK